MTEEKTSEGYMQKDRVGKTLEAYVDVFTDISNNLLFKKQLIHEEQLRDGPTSSIYKAADGATYREQHRDTAKYVDGANAKILLVGMENQSAVDSDMAIRMMGYDYASYRSQIDQGSHRYPVISGVLYFGDKKWNSAKSLKELLELPEEFQEVFSDYHINLIDVPRLSKEERDKLTSDFRVVADFFVNKDQEDYVPDDKPLDHPEAVCDLIQVFTGDDRAVQFTEDMIASARKERGEVRMCDLFDRLEAKGEARGEARGEVKGKAELIIDILTEYGDVSDSLKDTIMNQTDVTILNTWGKMAAKVNSIEEFEKAI